MTIERTYTCCLCGNEFPGYPNSAYPVMDGGCCDECNLKIVVPARLRRATEQSINKSEEYKCRR